MEQSKRQLWRKSMLQNLNHDKIVECLYEISDNGDMHGYDSEESGYYQDYKELFDDLSGGAWALVDAMAEHDLSENWDDMTVALLGETQTVLGFDAVEQDYYQMLDCDEAYAVIVAIERLKRLNKDELIRNFRRVMAALTSFFDIKAAHDCLTSIVEELDERGATLSLKNDEINRLYHDLTGANGEEFDRLIERIPQRMWAE